MTWRVRVDASALGVTPWPARVSVPLPPGHKADVFGVKSPDGSYVSAQSRVLTRWPDGSPRWVQLDFQAHRAGEHVVQLGKTGDAPAMPVVHKRVGGELHANVGRLTIVIDPASTSPIRRVEWDGKPVTDDADPFAFVVADRAGTPSFLTPASIDNVRVEAEGQHRLQLSWESHHADRTGKRTLDARLRIELLAGVEAFSLSYQFFHKLPNRPTLELSQIEARFGLGAMAAEDSRSVVVQTGYSNLTSVRFVRTKNRVPIRVDDAQYSPYTMDTAAIEDTFEYPPFLERTNQAVSPVVGVQSSRVAVLCAMHDLIYQRPKSVTVSPSEVRVGIWPRFAGPLKLLQGRSARQVFTFRFSEPDEDKVNRLAVDASSCRLEPALCWLDPRDSVHAGETWDQPRLFTGAEGGAATFHHLLASATSRWETVAEMFHFGDVPDVGYMMSYPSTGRMPQREAGRSRNVFGVRSTLHGHFHAPHEQPIVWTNNEYDAIYCVALEAIRSRSAPAMRQLVAAARHQLEVDFVHYSDHWQQHRSTPAHFYDHVAGTSSIASHQWTQGLYYYYALTGDDDTPEVVRAICDYNIAYVERPELQPFMYFNRELGWAMVALVFGYEMLGERKYLDFAGQILERLQQQANRTDFKDLKTQTVTTLPQNIATIGLNFATNTIPLGLKCYVQAIRGMPGHARARKLLIDWVALGMKNFNDRSKGVKITELFPETFTYVCELNGSRKLLRDSVWQIMMFFKGFGSLSWLDPQAGPISTKQYARVYRGLVHLLSSLARAGMLRDIERRLMEV